MKACRTYQCGGSVLAKRLGPNQPGGAVRFAPAAPMARYSAIIQRIRAQDGKAVPTAEYARMSTDTQEFSIANQEAAIAALATRFGYRVVRTYSDAGRSG